MQTTAITPSLIWQVRREGFGLGSFLPPLAFDAVTEKVFFCISVKLLSEKIRQLRWQVTQMSLHGLRAKSSHAGSMFTGRCSINSIQLPSTRAKENEAQDWYLENFFFLMAFWAGLDSLRKREQVRVSGLPKHSAMLEQAETPVQGQAATAVPVGSYNSVLVWGRKVVSGHIRAKLWFYCRVLSGHANYIPFS